MATRIMIDGRGANAAQIKAEVGVPQLICFYVTGSPDIVWTDAEKALFPASAHVTIDQGGNGSPVPDAMVRDVEPGAWSAIAAIRDKPWNTPRPTIYCDRSDLNRVIADGWRGDVWLAWPGYAGSGPPSFPGVNVVAVQNVFGGDRDSSLVYDPTWPHVATPTGPTPTLSVTVTDRQADMAWPVAIGADHYNVQYLADSAAVPVVIARPPQPKSGATVHEVALVIPGARGGTVDVYAIIASKPHLIGSVHLP